MKLLAILPPGMRSILRRLKRCFWFRLDELVLRRDLTSYTAPAASAAIHVDIDEPADPMPDIVRINPGLVKVSRRFLLRGYRAFICRINDVPAGYLWVHDASIADRHPSLDRFEIALGPRDAYLFNFFVLPEFRSGGVAGAFFAGMLTRLRDRGYRRACGFVVYDNIPARWMYAAHGWQTVYRFAGTAIASAVLLSNRGRYYSSVLLGILLPGFRRAVPEYLPLRRRARDRGPETAEQNPVS
jgi:GNAT superfamily N-acetyltransferase